MSINMMNDPSLKEQREELLKLNNDLLFGVYSLKEENNKELKLDYLEDVLTCYPNQFDNLKGITENSDITIVNLGALRKGEIEVLSGKKQDIVSPVLLSNGVIEFVEAKSKNGEVRKHLISTLRDGGAADKLQRTTTAGRNSGDNLSEDLEREHIEESPFLGYDKDGKLALATTDNSTGSKKLLKESINFFLENKYLKPGDENYKFVKKIFERNFPGIMYDKLSEILDNIIDNDRIFTYTHKTINDFEGLEEDIKKVSLKNSKGRYFVYFDRDNNTIEYRLLRTITGFNDGFKPLSKKPSRLYLESENQYPKIPRIEKATNGYVPTIKYFSERVENLLLKK
ncbi:MAG: hypothetical protein QM490_01735 [Candidatus Gracilibacteria bacterium]